MDQYRVGKLNQRLNELSFDGDGGAVGNFDGVFRGAVPFEEGSLNIIERLLDEVDRLQQKVTDHGY